jgi:predicted permease
MFLTIFTTVLLPLILLVGAAYALGRASRLDPAALARVTFYIFNPCLVFVNLATTTIAPELFGRLALLKLLFYALMAPAVYLIAGRLKLTGSMRSALLLGVVFANSGNYGLPVNEYAFGKDAVALALICFITDNLMVNSLGVFLAARGRASLRYALGQVLGNPAVYAIGLGLAANRLGWVIPLPLSRTLDLGSRATVPAMLVVLGMQLAVLPLDRRHWGLAGLAALLRLIVAPVLAAILVVPLGLTGLARQVGILQAAVPSAVSASIVASRYDTEPNLVAGSIMISSLASLVTVTAVIAWLS